MKIVTLAEGIETKTEALRFKNTDANKGEKLSLRQAYLNVKDLKVWMNRHKSLVKTHKSAVQSLL